MPKVHFVNEKICIEANVGERLSECIRKAGLAIETPCNGLGTCGKCKVTATGELSLPSELEKRALGDSHNIRLACQAVVEGDVSVELVNAKAVQMKTVGQGYSIDVPLKPGIEKTGPREVAGVAVDIGTTGISACLVNLGTGETISKISALNPQTEFGGDVLSRITYIISEDSGLEKLKSTVNEKIDSMIGELIGTSYKREDVQKVVVSANTTMLHMFMGVDPSSIARAPYVPAFLDAVEAIPADHGISVNDSAKLLLLPSASGYVGADIVSGVAATGFDMKQGICVFIDIGTNGEIVAISNGKMAATSTAAGPALEGMNISCGMRAQPGAIEAFKINSDLEIEMDVIEGGTARGICGSGLLDIVAELIRVGVIQKSGKFSKNVPDGLSETLRDKKFYITDDVFISQGDIRQIQLAKSAVATGVNMLLRELGIDICDVNEVVIAGAFGYHLNPESIKRVGLIPRGFDGKITFVGNSSMEGARLALLNTDMLDAMEGISKSMNVLELSTSQSFQDYFVKELAF